jgi:hypothetical protein
MIGHKHDSRVMTVTELRPYLRAYPRQGFAILRGTVKRAEPQKTDPDCEWWTSLDVPSRGN